MSSDYSVFPFAYASSVWSAYTNALGESLHEQLKTLVDTSSEERIAAA
ncbi:MAG: hypothetical protein IM613_13645 [Cytophagales bacterium]|nr:hypothetical protein [Cytophagales bacterium]